MKKILLTIVLLITCTTASAGPPPPATLWRYDAATNTLVPVIDGAGIQLSPSGGGTSVTCAPDSVSGLYECNMGFDIPSLTLTPKYGSSALFYVPSYTRIAPHSAGTGMLQYNGILLTKYNLGSTYYLKQLSDGAAYGTYLKQHWYCGETGTPDLTAQGWTDGEVSPDGYTLTAAYVTDSTGCAVLSLTGAITADDRYGFKIAGATLTNTKAQRMIASVKFPSTGFVGTSAPQFGSSIAVLGYSDAFGTNALLVGVFFAATGAVTNGYLTVWAMDTTPTPDAIRYKTVSTNVTSDYHDIEIYITDATFTVKLDGTTVVQSNDASTGGTAGNMAIRDIDTWSSIKPQVSFIGSGGHTDSSATLLIKQLDIIEQ